MDDQEIDKIAEGLSRLEPGKLPLKIFIEIARLTVIPILEVVPLRLGEKGSVEVLLLERDSADPIWGGLLHTPGTVIRASDTQGDYSDGFQRILTGELQGIQATDPVFVKNVLHKVKRGMEAAAVYWVEVLHEPLNGEFHEVSKLPEKIVNTQTAFIQEAARSFIRCKGIRN